MKSKIHTPYKLKDGTRVPGVTTITGQLSKPALIDWAWRLGCAGQDYKKFRDDKAEIGSLCHRMILDYFKKEKTDTSDYSKNQIDQAENSFLSFLEWEKNHKIEPILIEEPLVSEEFKYGGTLDLFGKVDDEYEITDFKTGSGIYKEMFYQVGGGYNRLIREKVHNSIQKIRILNIPRTEDESFREEVKTNLEEYWQAFYHLLQFYYVDKELK